VALYQELEKLRDGCLEEALEALVTILAAPLFSKAPQGLLHEFSQCHFLKGEPQTVLDTLCRATSKEGIFSPPKFEPLL